jgi:HSP20 family protein
MVKRRRYPSIFDIFENFMREPFSGDWPGGYRSRDPFRDLIKRFEEGIPEDLRDFVKEEETPAGRIQRYGPFVYGFSYTVEPGREPVFREFGNIRPSSRGIETSVGREPLVDVMEERDQYKIFVELPGVEKNDIKLDITEESIEIKTTEDKKYYKLIPLDSTVDPDSTKASYKNGVLSVELDKREKRKGKEISID